MTLRVSSRDCHGVCVGDRISIARGPNISMVGIVVQVYSCEFHVRMKNVGIVKISSLDGVTVTRTQEQP